MIQRKFHQLGEADRRLLVAASVQGQEFDSSVVSKALGLDAAEVEERLEVLDRVYAFVRLLREQDFPDGTPTLRYRFVHVLYQNDLYTSLKPTRRASLSAAVAQALVGFIAHIRRGLDAWRAAGSEVGRPLWLSLLAGALAKDGASVEALAVVDEALGAVARTGERLCEAELYRLKGELLLKHPVPAEQEANACFRQGIDIARGQNAKYVGATGGDELESSTPETGQERASSSHACRDLRLVHRGFDTADLKEAEMRLDELSAGA
jgi:hypothetical protein